LKESTFERAFIARVKKLPKVFVLPKEAPSSSRGVPDRILCVNSRFLALEMKSSMKKAMSKRNKLQEHTLFEVEAAGGFGVFVYPENQEIVFNQIKEIAGV